MTGPEHMAAAEAVLESYAVMPTEYRREWGAQMLAEAQAHATLARVAVAVDLAGVEVSEDWWRAVGR